MGASGVGLFTHPGPLVTISNSGNLAFSMWKSCFNNTSLAGHSDLGNGRPAGTLWSNRSCAPDLRPSTRRAPSAGCSRSPSGSDDLAEALAEGLALSKGQRVSILSRCRRGTARRPPCRWPRDRASRGALAASRRRGRPWPCAFRRLRPLPTCSCDRASPIPAGCPDTPLHPRVACPGCLRRQRVVAGPRHPPGKRPRPHRCRPNRY